MAVSSASLSPGKGEKPMGSFSLGKNIFGAVLSQILYARHAFPPTHFHLVDGKRLSNASFEDLLSSGSVIERYEGRFLLDRGNVVFFKSDGANIHFQNLLGILTMDIFRMIENKELVKFQVAFLRSENMTPGSLVEYFTLDLRYLNNGGYSLDVWRAGIDKQRFWNDGPEFWNLGDYLSRLPKLNGPIHCTLSFRAIKSSDKYGLGRWNFGRADFVEASRTLKRTKGYGKERIFHIDINPVQPVPIPIATLPASATDISATSAPAVRHSTPEPLPAHESGPESSQPPEPDPSDKDFSYEIPSEESSYEPKAKKTTRARKSQAAKREKPPPKKARASRKPKPPVLIEQASVVDETPIDEQPKQKTTGRKSQPRTVKKPTDDKKAPARRKPKPPLAKIPRESQLESQSKQGGKRSRENDYITPDEMRKRFKSPSQPSSASRELGDGTPGPEAPSLSGTIPETNQAPVFSQPQVLTQPAERDVAINDEVEELPEGSETNLESPSRGETQRQRGLARQASLFDPDVLDSDDDDDDDAPAGFGRFTEPIFGRDVPDIPEEGGLFQRDDIEEESLHEE
ncbi:hypothetical protein QBC47DRAFT_410602 [Echria macrotheca]|uniref:Uncharacterized protein n=1 Tax=Echria macrotheca TaxID=438768 RepID=A0AAJ0BKD7_9PEZI|nr:hypothetical protein QBC47DRAFT_410602 [Echria macrotheca]